MSEQRRRTARPRTKSPSPSTRAVRRRLARDLGKVVSYVATGNREAGRAGRVDFPAFVGELIGGVFEAVVDSSTRQMQAYAELLGDVANAVDDFSRDAVSGKRAGDRLRRKYPDLVQDDMAKPAKRQQLLATMVLMGINRIVVDEGRVSSRVHVSVSRSRPRARTKAAPR